MLRNAAGKVMWERRATLFLALFMVMVAAMVVGYTSKAYAAPGYLDPSFDTDGKVTTGFANDEEEAADVALQEDGKIVMAGRAYTGTTTGDDFALARYNANGSLDTSFGGDGKVETPIASGTNSDGASAVAVRADGKIVVAGWASNGSNYDFALARYNANGSLDTTFSGDGKVITAVGPAATKPTTSPCRATGSWCPE